MVGGPEGPSELTVQPFDSTIGVPAGLVAFTGWMQGDAKAASTKATFDEPEALQPRNNLADALSARG